MNDILNADVVSYIQVIPDFNGKSHIPMSSSALGELGGFEADKSPSKV